METKYAGIGQQNFQAEEKTRAKAESRKSRTLPGKSRGILGILTDFM